MPRLQDGGIIGHMPTRHPKIAALPVALALGSVAGCMFESDFLLYAACGSAADCDAAWGERRDLLGCMLTGRTSGYCTLGCEIDSDCPPGLTDDFLRECREVPLAAGTAATRLCVVACAPGDFACPTGMTCELDSLGLVGVCLFP